MVVYSVCLIYLVPPGADPYCIVKCGRQKAETPVIKNTLNPTFGSKVTFYVSNPAATEVTVQVRGCGRVDVCVHMLVCVFVVCIHLDV